MITAVSVSLPYWKGIPFKKSINSFLPDNVGYEEGDPRVIDSMKGGYPRFVLHPFVKKVYQINCKTDRLTLSS
jgi:cystathionine gamma-synthase